MKTADVAGHWLTRLAVLASVVALVLVIFGAFVRLSHAGLSCPDWPTCYGKATWPEHHEAIADANLAFPERPVDNTKTWREQGHRMVAGSLGLLVLGIALLAARSRRSAVALLLVAAVAAALGAVLYIAGHHAISAFASVLALALPIFAATRLDKPAPWRIAVVLFAVIVFQAMLGMWTVTWLLKPIVVMGHLLGGLTTLSLLTYVALRWLGVGADVDQPGLRRVVVIGLCLLGAQIALGGWTSANYAALTCGLDFPTCQGQWWPQTDFGEGFVLWRGIGIDYEGGILDVAARNAIHMTHRIGALLVLCYLLWLALHLLRRGRRGTALVLALGVTAQVCLGIANVKLGLPMTVALAHVGVAVFLLLTLIQALARTQRHVTVAD